MKRNARGAIRALRYALRAWRRANVLYVISYDIPEDKRRARLAKLLKGYGVRVQKSVFEADLDARGYADLRRRVDRLVDGKVDSVRFYRMCVDCRGQVETIGAIGVMEEPDVLIV